MDIETIIEKAVERGVAYAFEHKLPAILAALLPNNEAPITANEICRFAGISQPTLKKYREQGKLPFIKLGKSYRYIKTDVIVALTRNGVI
jgi:excisionase family DNA binding protein